jgi:hypothetical protein
MISECFTTSLYKVEIALRLSIKYRARALFNRLFVHIRPQLSRFQVPKRASAAAAHFSRMSSDFSWMTVRVGRLSTRTFGPRAR